MRPGARGSPTAPKAINVGEPRITVALSERPGPRRYRRRVYPGKETELLDFVPTDSLQFTPVGRDVQGEIPFYGDLCSPESCRLSGGLEHYKIRVFPYHPLLTHRFECGYMLWL
jgi:starch phosphorylase